MPASVFSQLQTNVRNTAGLQSSASVEHNECQVVLGGHINPNYPYAWLSKTLLLMVQNRPSEARQAANRLRQLEGTDSLTLQLDRIAHSYPDQAAAAALQALLKTAWDEI